MLNNWIISFVLTLKIFGVKSHPSNTYFPRKSHVPQFKLVISPKSFVLNFNRFFPKSNHNSELSGPFTMCRASSLMTYKWKWLNGMSFIYLKHLALSFSIICGLFVNFFLIISKASKFRVAHIRGLLGHCLFRITGSGIYNRKYNHNIYLLYNN